MKKVLVFKDGIFLEDKIADDDYLPNDNEYMTEINTTFSFFKPILVNGEVVEGKSQADIEAEELTRLLEPSEEEVRQAELQITILNILTEVGLL